MSIAVKLGGASEEEAGENKNHDANLGLGEDESRHAGEFSRSAVEGKMKGAAVSRPPKVPWFGGQETAAPFISIATAAAVVLEERVARRIGGTSLSRPLRYLPNGVETSVPAGGVNSNVDAGIGARD
jgi:hypothetical protein